MPATTTHIRTTAKPSAPVIQAGTSTSIPEYYLTDKTMAESAPRTSPEALFHHTTSTTSTDVSEEILQDAVTPTSMNSFFEQNILNHNSLPSEFPLKSAAVSSTATVAFDSTTTTSKSLTTTNSFNIFIPATVRTRCRTIIEERSTFSVKKGTSKWIICDSETFNSTTSSKQHRAVVAIFLLFVTLEMFINI
uniref:Uncharacterized protein n=1 Tax=Ascaris lumbricoides TaxID=6252 RepID=A0A0M3HRD2_ASCLU